MKGLRGGFLRPIFSVTLILCLEIGPGVSYALRPESAPEGTSLIDLTDRILGAGSAGLEEVKPFPVDRNVLEQLAAFTRRTAVDRDSRYILLFGREGRVLQAVPLPVELTGLAFPGHLRNIPEVARFIQQAAVSQSPPLQ